MSFSPTNVLYGGKYRVTGESAIRYKSALTARPGAWETSGIAREITYEGKTVRYWLLPDRVSGFPRGVPDTLAEEFAPAHADGYDSWIFNSIDDAMRDFATLNIHFDDADIRQVPAAEDITRYTADNFDALSPHFENGVLEQDVVELAGFDGFDRLEVGYAPVGYDDERRVLRLVWGQDKVVDLELPSATDLIGYGVEQVRLGDVDTYIGFMVEEADEFGTLGTPFEDWISGTEGDDTIRALSGDDSILGDLGSDIISGGAGSDYIDDWGIGGNFIDAGPGDDFVYQEGRSLVIGGPGNDELENYGDGGVFAFNAGGGHDAIRVAGALTLSLGAGVHLSDLTLSRDGEDFVLALGASDSIRLTRGEIDAWPQITLQHIDGGTVALYDFSAVLETLHGGVSEDPEPSDSIRDALVANKIDATRDHLIGGELASYYGRGGDVDALFPGTIRAVLADPLFGIAPQAPVESQGTVVQGTAGDDVLAGSERSDRIAGGPGNDTLAGGNGDDTYVFNPGDGTDRIVDTGGNDTLSFGPGVTPEHITLGLGSLLIRLGSEGDAIHVEGFDPLQAPASGAIEVFAFADGTRIAYEELLARGFDLTGTGDDEVLPSMRRRLPFPVSRETARSGRMHCRSLRPIRMDCRRLQRSRSPWPTSTTHPGWSRR